MHRVTFQAILALPLPAAQKKNPATNSKIEFLDLSARTRATSGSSRGTV